MTKIRSYRIFFKLSISNSASNLAGFKFESGLFLTNELNFFLAVGKLRILIAYLNKGKRGKGCKSGTDEIAEQINYPILLRIVHINFLFFYKENQGKDAKEGQKKLPNR